MSKYQVQISDESSLFIVRVFDSEDVRHSVTTGVYHSCTVYGELNPWVNPQAVHKLTASSNTALDRPALRARSAMSSPFWSLNPSSSYTSVSSIYLKRKKNMRSRIGKYHFAVGAGIMAYSRIRAKGSYFIHANVS